MRLLFQRVRVIFGLLRLWPHLALYILFDGDGLVRSDLNRWWMVFFKKAPSGRLGRLWALLWLMTLHPEFRNLFYKRLGAKARIFSFLCPPMSTLFIDTSKIGRGLFIQHGFATIIAAKSIGDNCWINQQVTIGYGKDGAAPELRDGVVVNAGAKVIGAVIVGENTVIGANAVVVKSLPPNCTAVGVPARAIKKDGRRC